MKAIKNSSPIHISKIPQFQAWLKEILFSIFEIQEFSFIGSAGKKEYSSDIDVAVVGNFEKCCEYVKQSELDYKIMYGFDEISLGVEWDSQIVQVDLMFTNNLEWSKFAYYSPDLLNGESKYKGQYRNLLISEILAVETKMFISETEYNQLVYRLNEGLVLVSKSYRSGKVGLDSFLKTPRIITSKLITNDPTEFLRIMRLNQLSFTVEQILRQLPDRLMWRQIEAKFKESCDKLNLEYDESIFIS